MWAVVTRHPEQRSKCGVVTEKGFDEKTQVMKLNHGFSLFILRYNVCH